jgi:hypothetical protein
MALDERRVKFIPNFHRDWEDEENICAAHPHQDNTVKSQEEPSSHAPPERQTSLQAEYERQVNGKTGQKTDSLEVWFAGTHGGLLYVNRHT